jgi:hypothetical protein
MTEKNSEVVAENVSAKVLETAGGDCRELSIKLDNASENNGRAAGGEHRRPVTCLDKPATTGADREVVARVIAGFGFEREPVERALEQLYMTKPAAPVADVLLTSRELQAQLKISATTLWRAGVLPHVQIGARRRYILREVLEHLAAKPRRNAAGKAKS